MDNPVQGLSETRQAFDGSNKKATPSRVAFVFSNFRRLVEQSFEGSCRSRMKHSEGYRLGRFSLFVEIDWFLGFENRILGDDTF